MQALDDERLLPHGPRVHVEEFGEQREEYLRFGDEQLEVRFDEHVNDANETRDDRK